MSESLEIARYHTLCTQGAITKEEFEEKKKSLLQNNNVTSSEKKSTDILPKLLDDYPHWFWYLLIWFGIIGFITTYFR